MTVNVKYALIMSKNCRASCFKFSHLNYIPNTEKRMYLNANIYIYSLCKHTLSVLDAREKEKEEQFCTISDFLQICVSVCH